jgi:hypothetical protein
MVLNSIIPIFLMVGCAWVLIYFTLKLTYANRKEVSTCMKFFKSFKFFVIPADEHDCSTAACATFGRFCATAALLPMNVSVQQQPVMPLDVPVQQQPVLPLDGSVLKQPVLPGRICSKAACAIHPDESVLQHYKLPLQVSVLLFCCRLELSLDVCLLCCNWTSLVYCSLCCP